MYQTQVEKEENIEENLPLIRNKRTQNAYLFRDINSHNKRLALNQPFHKIKLEQSDTSSKVVVRHIQIEDRMSFTKVK